MFIYGWFEELLKAGLGFISGWFRGDVGFILYRLYFG